MYNSAQNVLVIYCTTLHCNVLHYTSLHHTTHIRHYIKYYFTYRTSPFNIPHWSVLPPFVVNYWDINLPSTVLWSLQYRAHIPA